VIWACGLCLIEASHCGKPSVRSITYQGLLNVVDAARSSGFQGRITLASVVGADRSSLLISILNTIKSGLQRNLMERELYSKSKWARLHDRARRFSLARRLAKRMSALLQQFIG
jgi:hypothetical protein